MTVLDLIQSSMRLLRANASGETITAAEAADGLAVLNQMIDGWNADHAAPFVALRQEFSLAGGQDSYTLGVGGNFNTARPQAIDAVGLLLYGYEYPLKYLTTQEWAHIFAKPVVAIPGTVWDDGGFPLRTLKVWPKPSIASSLVIYSRGALGAFTSLAQAISLPPGYERALRYNLAMELAPEYKAEPPSDVIVAIAQQSFGEIKRANLQPVDILADPLIVPQVSGERAITGARIVPAQGHVPTGAIDGVNKVFTFPFPPDPNILQFFWNGVLQVASNGDYTLDGSIVTMKQAPSAGPPADFLIGFF